MEIIKSGKYTDVCASATNRLCQTELDELKKKLLFKTTTDAFKFDLDLSAALPPAYFEDLIQKYSAEN